MFETTFLPRQILQLNLKMHSLMPLCSRNKTQLILSFLGLFCILLAVKVDLEQEVIHECYSLSQPVSSINTQIRGGKDKCPVTSSHADHS